MVRPERWFDLSFARPPTHVLLSLIFFPTLRKPNSSVKKTRSIGLVYARTALPRVEPFPTPPGPALTPPPRASRRSRPCSGPPSPPPRELAAAPTPLGAAPSPARSGAACVRRARCGRAAGTTCSRGRGRCGTRTTRRRCDGRRWRSCPPTTARGRRCWPCRRGSSRR